MADSVPSQHDKHTTFLARSCPGAVQDLSSTTPWAVITPQFGTFSGGRRLLAAPLTKPPPANATVDVNLTARELNSCEYSNFLLAKEL